MEHDASLLPDDLLEVVTEQMTLSAQVQHKRLRVLVRGEVDVATAAALSRFVLSALTPEIAEQVIDLSGVTFLDSSGVRALVLAAREASARGVAFSVLCPEDNTAVRMVLEILQISTMLTVVTTDSRQRG